MHNLDLIIQNGEVVNADKRFRADLGIKNGKITEIAKKLPTDEVEVIDAENMFLFPGGIDVHVHNNYYFCGTYSENWDSTTAGGACGGVTTFIDFAIQQKGSTLHKAVENRIDEAKGQVCIDYSLHAGITDWNEKTKEEMNYYTGHGIPSFKMWSTYRKEGIMADDAAVFEALEETKKCGALLMLHAESDIIMNLLIKRYHTDVMMKEYGAYCHTLSRPDFTEYEAIQRAATWARVTGGRLYFVHVSSGRGADIIAREKKAGVKIWAETCPQYLLLNDSVFKNKEGHYYATCPQVKKKRDSATILKRLKTGAIQILSTDTCAFTAEQKNMWEGDFTKIPYGLPGLETRIPTMYTFLVGKNNFSLKKFIALVSTNPAKLFGLYPEKGVIKVGSDADIVVFDPGKKVSVDYKKLITDCDWSPYQGMKLTGYPYITISRGKVIARDGKFLGKPGWGRFVERKPNGII